MTTAMMIPAGSTVVIATGRHANEPGVVVADTARQVTVLLGRTGERVTVRKTSVDIYDTPSAAAASDEVDAIVGPHVAPSVADMIRVSTGTAGHPAQ